MISFAAFADELEKIALSDQQFKKLERKVQPGDILMTTGTPALEDKRLRTIDVPGAAVGRAIGIGFGGRYHHAGMYVGDNKWVDLNPATGVTERDIRGIGTGSVMVYRPRLPEKDRQEAVGRMRGFVGKKYSVPQVVRNYFAKVRGTTGDKRKAAKNLICTNIVADSYRGKLDLGRESELVGPWDIHGSKNVKKVMHLKGKPG